MPKEFCDLGEIRISLRSHHYPLISVEEPRGVRIDTSTDRNPLQLHKLFLTLFREEEVYEEFSCVGMARVGPKHNRIHLDRWGFQRGEAAAHPFGRTRGFKPRVRYNLI